MKSSGTQDEAKPDKTDDCAYKGGLGIRHLQVAVMSTAAFISYSLRINLSVVIVAMVDAGKKTITESSTAVGEDTSTDSSTQTFDWDEKIQGYVLGSFFSGYVVTQIPAGMLSSRFGGHRFLCAGILSSSALSLVVPQCAFYGGWILVCVNRAFQGVSQGFVFPSIYTLLGVWAPPTERSRLTSVAVSAQLLGTVVCTPVTGYLISIFGWPSVFYVTGATGAVFGVIMIFLGADYPCTHRMISHAEKTYIQTSLGGAKEKQHVPWKHAFKSIPYLSAVFVMGFHGAVMVVYLTKIPTYLGTVHKFSIADVGLLTALPYLVSWILTFVWSGLCDLLIGRGWLKVTPARKLFNSIALYVGASFMVLLAFAENRIYAVVFLTLAVGLQSGVFVGFQSTFVDLAPNFSGAIYSLSNCISNCLAMFSPPLIGFIVTEAGSKEQWRIVFYICASVLALGNTVYVIWSSSKTQYWNWPDRYKNKQEYEDSKNKVEREPEVIPARRYSLYGAELME